MEEQQQERKKETEINCVIGLFVFDLSIYSPPVEINAE